MFDKLADDDFVGIIPLGPRHRSGVVPLGKKRDLKGLKEMFIKEIAESFFPLSLCIDEYRGRRLSLNKALDTAQKWLMNQKNSTHVINSDEYLGPHKWIVSLLGAPFYSPGTSFLDLKGKAQRNPNLNISTMILTTKQ